MLLSLGCLAAAFHASAAGAALAQSTSGERELSERDRTAVRWVYRVQPALAKELEKALRSASTEAEIRSNLTEFQKKLTKMKQEGERIPEAYRLPNWHAVVAISEAAFRHVWRDPDWSDAESLSSEPFAFEDEITSKLGLNGYQELYDFFRETRGKNDFGHDTIKQLKALKEEDSEKYTEALHGLLDDLKAYRASKGKARVVRIRPGDEVKVEDRAVGAEKTRKAENRSVRRPAQPVRP